MIGRIVALILVLIILVGGGVLIYQFFRGPKATTTKTMTINKDGKFDTKNLKIANNENFKIKNSDDKNHTVKKTSDNSAVADLDQGQTTREMKFSSDTKNSLYLADNTGEKADITVGSPKTATTTTNTTPTPKPVTLTPSTANPLPNTGPQENAFIILASTLSGILLYFISRIYLKSSFRKKIQITR